MSGINIIRSNSCDEIQVLEAPKLKLPAIAGASNASTTNSDAELELPMATTKPKAQELEPAKHIYHLMGELYTNEHRQASKRKSAAAAREEAKLEAERLYREQTFTAHGTTSKRARATSQKAGRSIRKCREEVSQSEKMIAAQRKYLERWGFLLNDLLEPAQNDPMFNPEVRRQMEEAERLAELEAMEQEQKALTPEADSRANAPDFAAWIKKTHRVVKRRQWVI